MLWVVVVIVSKGHQTYSANILGLVTDHSRSHCIIQEALMKALAARGHNVSNFVQHMSQLSSSYCFCRNHHRHLQIL